MGLKAYLLQFAVLYAPLLHIPPHPVTPFLTRGMDPHTAQIYKLHDEGYKTIISMRTNPQKKKQRLCEKLGMEWIWIKTGIFHSPTEDQFDRFRSIVNDPTKRKIYTSCEVGMDRTGVYIAAYRLVDQHWTVEQMAQEFKDNHQKRWWPAFRKYQSVVVAYAEKKKEEAAQGNSDTSGKPPNLEASRQNPQSLSNPQSPANLPSPDLPLQPESSSTVH